MNKVIDYKSQLVKYLITKQNKDPLETLKTTNIKEDIWPRLF